jgi:hypothetical protein
MQVHKALATLKKKAPPKVTLNFKIVKAEAEEIKGLAKRYTKGNVTALIRIAVRTFKPKTSELTRVK